MKPGEIFQRLFRDRRSSLRNIFPPQARIDPPERTETEQTTPQLLAGVPPTFWVRLGETARLDTPIRKEFVPNRACKDFSYDWKSGRSRLGQRPVSHGNKTPCNPPGSNRSHLREIPHKRSAELD